MFINIDLDTMKEWPGVARLLIGALINPVLRAEGKMKNRLLFLLDEAHVLGTMRLLETVRDGLRKFGITLILVYQSVGQLVECFGRQSKTKWYGSLSFRSYARIIDPDTCEEISEACGDMTVEVENRSRQWGFFGWGAYRQGDSINLARRPLILPQEIAQTMRADEQIVIVTGRPPIRCGRAIYFRRPEMVAIAQRNRFAGASNA